jgi:PKD repeat protein
MDYWLEAGGGMFTIEFNIAEGDELESLTFNEFPTPVSVTVNSVEWWKTDTNFAVSGSDITISDIPTGATTVVIDFNEEITNQAPVPSFTMTPEGTVGVNEEVSFDASASYDPDGLITSFIWDFDDTITGSGETTTHTFTAPGTYTVRLTVRDDFVDYAEDFIEKDITVEFGAEDDTDSDDLKDFWEWENFGNLDQTGSDDADADGYSNMLEFLAESDPADSSNFKEDSDNDTMDDLKEWEYFESLQYTADEDPDNDKATNKEELDAGTDPLDPESKPKSDDPGDDDGEGMLGLGKMAGIDMFLIILIVIIVVVIAIVGMVVSRSRKAKSRKDAEMAAQQMAQVPVRGPPPVAAPQMPPPEHLEAMPPEPPTPPMPTSPEPMPMPQVEEAPALPEPVAAPVPMPMPEEAEGAIEEEAAEADLPAEPTRDDVVNSFTTELDIGVFEAGVLYDSGYTSYEALEGAIVEEIAMIDEIGEDMAEKIMNNLQFVVAGGAAAAAVADGEAEAADEALADEGTEAEAADEALAEEETVETEEAPAEEPVEEEPAEEETGEDEMMECPVCGEPAEPGSANCPVCDSPL